MIRPFAHYCATIVILLLALTLAASAANWEQDVNTRGPGAFTEPRPHTATYRFSWGEFKAGTGNLRFAHAGDRLLLQGTASTNGTVRSLWKFDVTHNSVVDAKTLRPLEMRQTETVRSKLVETSLNFTADGVVRTRTEKDGSPGKAKEFKAPSLYDLLSALLYIRSQPLPNGAAERIVVYPETSAYLATATVEGREEVTVPAGSFPAIKLNLDLKKIGKTGELEPHKKFRRASIWLSDDADRLVLKIEGQIFVGTVTAELESVEFGPKKG